MLLTYFSKQTKNASCELYVSLTFSTDTLIELFMLFKLLCKDSSTNGLAYNLFLKGNKHEDIAYERSPFIQKLIFKKQCIEQFGSKGTTILLVLFYSFVI